MGIFQNMESRHCSRIIAKSAIVDILSLLEENFFMYFILLCVIGILCEKMCIFIRQEITLTKEPYLNVYAVF